MRRARLERLSFGLKSASKGGLNAGMPLSVIFDEKVLASELAVSGRCCHERKALSENMVGQRNFVMVKSMNGRE